MALLKDSANVTKASVYGIPYGCLIPVNTNNVLVACRGAGFSHIAASSCRLSKSMLQLGYAAGTAAILAIQKGHRVSDVPVDMIQKEIKLYDLVTTLEKLMK